MANVRNGGWVYKQGQVVVHALRPGGLRKTLCGLKADKGWLSILGPKHATKCPACRRALK